MSNADTVIVAIRSGYERLADLVKKFDDETLAGPSAATEWDIAQVLSHLGSGAEIMTNTLQLAVDGQPPAAGDFNQTVWARWDSSSRREQADGFLEWNDKFLAQLESLTEDQRDNLRIEFSWLPAPIDIAHFARMRLNELTYHSWDVRSAADPEATLDAAAVPEMLQTDADLSWVSKPAELNGQTAVLTVTTTDPSKEFTLRLADPVSLEATPAAEPDGTLTLPAESWLRLSAGRLAADRTPKSVELTGPISLDTLRKVFAGY
ncbi:maleylpyruvate isomerase family mycothiol-dependent enzyme [Kribbella albertanoniae]|uniref:Maleylpyruvate isomerase family mycothiol-dependent enzyme n=1 Tax=Kribbella albertanoniae TaxID=1266829 RepID=A0A4R4PVY5_9ACTN|nr:maleylpyruvate isomerase family mycothiol-dependent enzyme [Kribbella albertanoniae]TDC26628.1 maleylpyruvate isomerase family mycothiol-dependent enzyme [Kribbella albertanoniae]